MILFLCHLHALVTSTNNSVQQDTGRSTLSNSPQDQQKSDLNPYNLETNINNNNNRVHSDFNNNMKFLAAESDNLNVKYKSIHGSIEFGL